MLCDATLSIRCARIPFGTWISTLLIQTGRVSRTIGICTAFGCLGSLYETLTERITHQTGRTFTYGTIVVNVTFGRGSTWI